ncbi:MAG: type II toxin-antitoxin system VapB family antitoxin [Actinomycetota bacterium]
MPRLSVALDRELLAEAVRLTGARTKRAALDAALREFVARRRRRDLVELAGSGLVDMDLEELRRWRARAGEGL